MYTCSDHDYQIVESHKLLHIVVHVECSVERCEYKVFLGRRLKWRVS